MEGAVGCVNGNGARAKWGRERNGAGLPFDDLGAHAASEAIPLREENRWNGASSPLRIEFSVNAGFGNGKQIEIFPDFGELAFGDLTNQDNRDFQRGAWRRPICRGRPLVGDHRLMHVLPTESRAFGIREHIERQETLAGSVRSRGHGSIREFLDLIEPVERLARRHDHPFAIRCPQAHQRVDTLVGHRIGERIHEITGIHWFAPQGDGDGEGVVLRKDPVARRRDHSS